MSRKLVVGMLAVTFVVVAAALNKRTKPALEE